MGVCGTPAKTFAAANLAHCADIHLDGGYPHVFFDVVAHDGEQVTLKSHGDGSQADYTIHRDRYGDFAVIEQRGTYEAVFGLPPHRFKIRPFNGKRTS